MSTLEWPSELPLPERNTWQSRTQDPRQRRGNDAGPPAYRRKYSSAALEVSLSVILTRDERAIFDQFYLADTKHGTAVFTMPDPTTDGWALMGSDGSGLLTDDSAPILLSGEWLCQFGETVPAETITGIDFRKSFSILVMP